LRRDCCGSAATDVRQTIPQKTTQADIRVFMDREFTPIRPLTPQNFDGTARAGALEVELERRHAGV